MAIQQAPSQLESSSDTKDHPAEDAHASGHAFPSKANI